MAEICELAFMFGLLIFSTIFFLIGSIISFIKNPINFILFVITLSIRPELRGTTSEIVGEYTKDVDCKKSTIKNYLKENDIKYKFIVKIPISGFFNQSDTIYKIY